MVNTFSDFFKNISGLESSDENRRVPEMAWVKTLTGQDVYSYSLVSAKAEIENLLRYMMKSKNSKKNEQILKSELNLPFMR